MLDTPLDSPVVAGSDRPSFTASHRAQAVCTREFQRLSDEVAKGLKLRHAAGEVEAPVVSQSPGRCMVQLGPVALTLAWLRSRLDVVSDGQLMIVFWKGAVVQGMRRIPERAAPSAAASATMLREDNYVVLAENEESWRWHAESAALPDADSSALAERCVAELLRNHAAHATPA